MKLDGSLAAKFTATLAIALLGYGCGSSGSGGGAGGSGGSAAGGSGGGGGGAGHGGTGGGGQGGSAAGGHGGTASGGQGGTATGGQGGATDGGQGGATDAGSDAPVALSMCASAPVDQSACNSAPSCFETCGLNVSALTTTKTMRVCTCSGPMASGGKWSCPGTAGSCVYPPDIDLSCFLLPTPLPLCTLADGGASAIVRSGVSACEVPPSEVCGNVCGSAMSNVMSYQDAAGTAHVGYCVCIAGVYQCATVNDWPKP